MWCGETACTKTNADFVRKAIREYHGVFMLGCQGPDPFYLYHRMPWQSKKDFKEVLHYGDVLHKEHINETFRMLLEESRESMNHLDIAYVMGFMTQLLIRTFSLRLILLPRTSATCISCLKPTLTRVF